MTAGSDEGRAEPDALLDGPAVGTVGDADPLPPPTGHPPVDAVLEQARQQLAAIAADDLPARRSVLDQTQRTLRALLETDAAAASDQPETTGRDDAGSSADPA